MGTAQRGLEALRPGAGFGMDMRGTQDIAEPQHQAAQFGMELSRLGPLRGPPDMSQQPRRHRLRARYYFAIAMQRRCRVQQHLLQGLALALAQASRSGFPQIRQAPLGPVSKGATNLGLQLQRMPAQAFAFDAARRNFTQHAIHQRRQGTHAARAIDTIQQHQRKIMAQRGQIPIRRQQGREQFQSVDGLQGIALALSGQMKDLLRRLPGLHVHRRVSFRLGGGGRHGAQAPCCAEGSSSGHTVYLSNSRSRPA